MIRIRLATMEDYEAICHLCRQVDALHVGWYPGIFSYTGGPKSKQSIYPTVD